MQPNNLSDFDTLERNIDALNNTVGQGFWDVVYADPFTYLGFIFAFWAAIAFLTFLRGFLSGFPYVLSMDWHEEHQEHYRIYAVQGVMMLLYLFLAWEVIRWAITGVASLLN